MRRGWGPRPSLLTVPLGPCPLGAFPQLPGGQNPSGSQRTGLFACSYPKYPLVSEGPEPWALEPHRPPAPAWPCDFGLSFPKLLCPMLGPKQVLGALPSPPGVPPPTSVSSLCSQLLLQQADSPQDQREEVHLQVQFQQGCARQLPIVGHGGRHHGLPTPADPWSFWGSPWPRCSSPHPRSEFGSWGPQALNPLGQEQPV